MSGMAETPIAETLEVATEAEKSAAPAEDDVAMQLAGPSVHNGDHEPALQASAAEAAPETAHALHAFLFMHCSSCRYGNEVSVPVGDEREFTVQCHSCKALNLLTVETSGEPLIVAEGLAAWSQPPPEPTIIASSVPPKKRPKTTVLVPSSTPADADEAGNASTDSEEEEVLSKRKAASGVKPKGKATQSAKAAAAAAAAAVAAAAVAAAASVPPAKAKKAKAAKKGGAAKREPVPAEPPPLPASEVRPAVVKAGSAVLALFHDGYYYTGVVEAIKEAPTPAKCQFKIAWDDGDPASWVGAADVSLAYRQPMASELQPGERLLAVFAGVCSVQGRGDDAEDEEEKDLWFPARVVKRMGAPDESVEFELAWLDGGERFVARSAAPLAALARHSVAALPPLCHRSTTAVPSP